MESLPAKAALSDLPGAFFYPNFISAELESALMAECALFKGSDRGISRRYGPKVSVFTPPPQGYLPAQLTVYLEELKRSDALGGHAPFQISVNVYEEDRGAMVPHKDGRGNRATILSLGTPAVLEFHHDKEPNDMPILQTKVVDPATLAVPPLRVCMAPRSLLLLTGAAFTEYLHGITQRDEDNLEGVINRAYTTALPTVVKRGKRVSIVTWA